jgi:hypothetical protein
MQYICPGYTVPSRKTLTTRIEKLFKEQYQSAKDEVIKQPKGNIHITHDAWTSDANVSYYVVTAHWLDENFYLQERVLSVRPVSGHSANDIQADLSATVAEFLISNPVATVDNCSAEINGVTQVTKS